MKIKLSFLLPAAFLLSFGTTVLADQRIGGNETSGWKSFPSGQHWTTKTLYYRFDNVSSALQSVTNRGASAWRNSIPGLSIASESAMSPTPNGTVSQFYNSSSQTRAEGGNFYYTGGFSAYHNYSWILRYNTYWMPTTNTNRNTWISVHEIGHAFGLDHVYWTCNARLGCDNSYKIDNSNNAMYNGQWEAAVDYWSSLGRTWPASEDIAGAKYINGW